MTTRRLYEPMALFEVRDFHVEGAGDARVVSPEAGVQVVCNNFGTIEVYVYDDGCVRRYKPVQCW